MLFIFDMGGVVTNTFEFEKMFSKLCMNREDFFNICKKPEPDIYNRLETGKISVHDFWYQFNNRVGAMQRDEFDGIIDMKQVYKMSDEMNLSKIPEIESDLFRLYFHPQLNEETVALIKDLRKKHRVVCGTNTIQSHWENHMERGDYSYFDQTYASNKIGYAKPDTKYFEIIMEAEGFKPEETFFTDDREDNCNAAAKCGITVHQFTSAQDLRKVWSKYL